ncbi:MAG: hypothetical protein A2X67_09270 [Ignavibacteria bacterium GWA2_55_11]|nr:MAG: hypothetical protein A2X67_09270 [Ignavibacteria bacterium GWA2_55_11]OGU70612.1 MAG: hypothetical protein A3H45_02920 [Ignavibacteria bacterium RIFCSPLOWO2_02_FULL_55_14]
MLSAAFALIPAATLCALTREVDCDLAVMAMCCRVSEGIVIAGIAALMTLSLLSVATESTAAAADADAVAVNTLGALLMKMGDWTGVIAATCFALGSTLFPYLFLRGRIIPVSLAWLGVLTSLLILEVLPLRLAGFIEGPVTYFSWLPMLAFEMALALWLLIKGAAIPQNL